MKVLMCHNHYQQRGGECLVFESECALLQRYGNHVIRYTQHNDAIHGMGSLRVVGKTFWNRQSYDALRDLMRRERPDVMHCTNTFPLISPAAYDAARAEGVPVVQALHNYRLLCAGAQLMRDGAVCESCLGKPFGLPGVLHGCYRGSRGGTLVVAAMTAAHRLAGTWNRKVDVYTTCSEFARQKHVEGGLPADRILTKPNFIDPDPGPGDGAGGYAVFVGRLSPEKGIDTMLDAWEHVGPSVPLKIIGDGPLCDRVKAACERHPHITWLGYRPMNELLEVVGGATCLVMPSIWYEGMPRTILEAFAKGTPPIVSELGAMSELVEHGVTGLRFRSGDAKDLAEKVTELHGRPELRQRLRSSARAEYLAKYTAEVNYPLLMAAYHRAIDRRRTPGVTPPLAAAVMPPAAEEGGA